MSIRTQVEVLVAGTTQKKVCWVLSELESPKVGDFIAGLHEVIRVFDAVAPQASITKNIDKLDQVVARGDIKVTEIESGNVLFEDHNVIVNTIRSIFARLLVLNTEPLSSVWGLAIGAGGTGSGGWSSNTQPDPTPTQTAMVSEIKRKPYTTVTYLDGNGNPTAAITNVVQFNTIFNATIDNITLPIREMGLIGGGTTNVGAGGPTNMLTAPYWNPSTANPNSVTLMTYKTNPPFILPPGIDCSIAWSLTL